MADAATLTRTRGRLGLSLPLLLGLLVYGQIISHPWARCSATRHLLAYRNRAVDPRAGRGAAPGRILLLDARRALVPAGTARRNLHRLARRPFRLGCAGRGHGALRGRCIGAAAARVAALSRPGPRADCRRADLGACAHARSGATAYTHPAHSVLWVAALVSARSEERAPSLWLALLITLWANLHSSYMLGLVLAALLAGEAVLLAPDWGARLRAVRGWAVFGGASAAAALITPFGIHGLIQPFELTQMSYSSAVLVEWMSPNFQRYQPLEALLMVLLFGGFSLGWRLPPTRVLIVLLLLHMALQHGRHGEPLGFIAPLRLAPALGRQLAERLARRPVLATRPRHGRTRKAGQCARHRHRRCRSVGLDRSALVQRRRPQQAISSPRPPRSLPSKPITLPVRCSTITASADI